METHNMEAVILAAGRGTRMRDDSLNKVCFECAGVPVIRRTVLNMREAGITGFVIVVGHMAQDVMNALDGIDGITYVYQKEQNGTGHATRLGLSALKTIGYKGPVLVSMGDRVISTPVVRAYIRRAREQGKALFAVQQAGINKSGGRVVCVDDKPYGIVEFADAAMMKLAETPENEWESTLASIGMSKTKADKLLKKAKSSTLCATRNVGGRVFTADEILNAPYTNISIYCFDLDSAMEKLEKCTAGNAQGEIYITDIIEQFCLEDNAQIYKITSPEDILTYSTKEELIRMSRSFMRSASAMREDCSDERVKKMLSLFVERFGDAKVLLSRAPGRVNILGRHIDHRGGNLNVMAINRDTLLVVAPREDRTVRISNSDPAFADYTFNIDEVLHLAPNDDWVSFIESEPVRALVQSRQGEWVNYVMAAVLRFQFTTDLPLCGMDILMDGTIPVAAGLSSSSSIVVSMAEAIVNLNCLHIDKGTFIELCGDGEWFVGTRGGAGDQAAVRCSEQGRITQLGFKPFYVGSSERFSDDYAIIVADTNIKSKKSGGSKDIFNARVAAYELSFMLLKKYFPEYDMHELRDVAKIRPYSMIYKMLKRIPRKATREELLSLLPESTKRIEQIFSNHADPGTYNLRGAALFGISECARSADCLSYLRRDDYIGLGKLMKISHDGDRISPKLNAAQAKAVLRGETIDGQSNEWPLRITDEYLIAAAETDADVALQPGAYACSIREIDAICDLLNATEGVLGSQMLGAGLGGCLAALVEKDKAADVIEVLNREYYDVMGYPHLAHVFAPMQGSSVQF